MKIYHHDIRLPKYIRLASGGYMSLKSKPIVMRLHSSNKKNLHEGIYAEILLYLPWRNERDLHEDNYEKCLSLFNHNKDIIMNNKNSMFPSMEMIDSVREMSDSLEDTRPEHLADNLDSFAQQENADDQDALDERDPLDLTSLPVEGESKVPEADGCPYKPIPVCTKEMLVESAMSLSYSQRVAFDKVITFVKSVRRGRQFGKSTILAPPHLIVHGNR